MTFDAARDHWEFFRAQTGAVLEKAGNRRMSALEQLQQNVAEEQKKLRAERPTIVLGVPGYGLGHDGFWAGFLAHASDNKVDENDCLRCYFTVDDRVQKQEDKKYCVSVIPEDWNFCRSACSVDPDVRIFATRKVRIEHRGDASYCNDQAWGAWTYDRESLGVQPELEEQEEEQRIAG